ncbi:T9SS type A sorting domain-containing protein [candidate division TA06 bacterium]|nr:T9SS type A sorting domain-containing protein [candidate division TA06 bacterium]
MKLDLGPYYTYQEAQAEAYNLAALYPSLVSQPESIGASHQSRKITAFSLSKDPGLDNGCPGVLITGVHHGREPIGCSVCLGFARYLCENYNNDPAARYMVDNRQLWFVPIINPDGYIFNADSSSDGLWRKNRRDNGDGTFGVDLNRNYPYMWGYDDEGSGVLTEREDYRGPYAASEPEVQAMVNFTQDKGFFKSILNFHSAANQYIIPWNYENIQTPDSLKLYDLAREMSLYNGYTYGVIWEISAQSINGCAEDWHYGERSTKPKAYPVCVEVGEDFFQPDTAIIQEQIAENIRACMLAGLAAGYFVGQTGGMELIDENGNGSIEPGESVCFADSVKNHSMDYAASQIKAYLSSDDAYIDIIQASADFGDFAPRQVKSNQIEKYEFKVDAACPPGHQAQFYLTFISDYDSYLYSEGLAVRLGNQTDGYVFEDSTENGTGNWTHSGDGDLWHITANSYNSPSHSWYCGNEGTWDYLDNMNCRLVSGVMTVDSFTSTEFWHSHSLENGYDIGYVEISTNNGLTWKQLGDKITGNSGGWVKKTISLAGYSGSIRLGFRMDTDISVHNYSGWHIDDIKVSGYNVANAAPARPSALEPCDETIADPLPVLHVSRSGDPDGDAVHYGYKIYSDSLLTQIYAETDSSAADTSWQVPIPLVPGNYWWRAYADDGKERSLFSPKTRIYYSATGAGQDSRTSELPAKYALSQNHPNPMTGSTRIDYQIPRPGMACLKIYNIQGQQVKVLENSIKQAGYYSVKWDGKDYLGKRAAAGIYICRMEINDFKAIKKIIVLR